MARSIRLSTNVRSRSTYSWNQNGWRPVASATASIGQMLMVDKVNGMPCRFAARAARISPSACCMPVNPVGAIATGMLTGWPTMVLVVLRSVMSTATRWRNSIR
ncbi:hypothetical protein D3C72_1386970 [compost metagenome]